MGGSFASRGSNLLRHVCPYECRSVDSKGAHLNVLRVYNRVIFRQSGLQDVHRSEVLGGLSCPSCAQLSSSPTLPFFRDTRLSRISSSSSTFLHFSTFRCTGLQYHSSKTASRKITGIYLSAYSPPLLPILSSRNRFLALLHATFHVTEL